MTSKSFQLWDDILILDIHYPLHNIQITYTHYIQCSIKYKAGKLVIVLPVKQHLYQRKIVYRLSARCFGQEKSEVDRISARHSSINVHVNIIKPKFFSII